MISTTLSSITSNQGTAGATAWKVDGSAVVQPVSGTILNPPTDGTKATYSAAKSNLVMATSATDVFTIAGSATKTIRIVQFAVTVTGTTGANDTCLLIKRSTLATGGTSTAVTAVPHDSADAAATATVLSYTANPTALGAPVGNVVTYKLAIPTTSSPFYANGTIFEATRPSKAIVLRGALENLALNLNSNTVAGNTADIFVEWTEE